MCRVTVTAMSTGAPEERPAWLIPLDEFTESFKDYVPPDRTPLSEAEQAELRRRLNAPGGDRLKLTFREREARYKMGLIRSREAIVAMYRQVKEEKDAPRFDAASREFGEGVLAAIEWATGVEAHAPVTGTVPAGQPPTVPELLEEAQAAEEAAQRRRVCPRGWSYAAGVEHTLLWLLARTDTRPWGHLRDA